MTSEEALKNLKELRELWELNCWSNDDIHWELMDKVIEDLEVLEILKKYYKSDGWSNGGVIKFWEMTESQLKKIKEWLENDSRK